MLLQWMLMQGLKEEFLVLGLSHRTKILNTRGGERAGDVGQKEGDVETGRKEPSKVSEKGSEDI